ncbi:MAG: cell wall hydrolase [Paracoccus sp. (in: a-proteobacteria)]|nr:cell wall hydrolase [Paracoccus sp. (in: a-proteobacteria)]MDO5370877.1 cell wall hydrolase [Paracoccus sp. (in: a-proteobacteria)]
MFKRHSELGFMERAMYFKSTRSSRDGMVAVGSVVMNRVASGQHARPARRRFPSEIRFCHGDARTGRASVFLPK